METSVNREGWDAAYVNLFEAEVLEATDQYVVLSDTAFTPQDETWPGDSGVIAGREISLVTLDGGQLKHWYAAPNDTTLAGRVRGQLDWQRRHSLMRMDRGLHLLLDVIGRLHGEINVTRRRVAPVKAELDFEAAEPVNFEVGTAGLLGAVNSELVGAIDPKSPSNNYFGVRRGGHLDECKYPHVQSLAEVGELVAVLRKSEGRSHRIEIHSAW